MSYHFIYGEYMISLITVILLIATGIIDAKTKRIPNALLLIMLAVGFAHLIFFSDTYTDKIIGFIFPSAVMLAARCFGASVGAGDIKLFSCLGLICGYVINSAVFIISCVSSLVFYAVSRYCFKKECTSLAFAPFTAFSYIVITCVGIVIYLQAAA